MNIRNCCGSIATCCLLVAAIGLSPCILAAPHGTSTVAAGNVRFQFLTPSLVRMEYSPSGDFVDAPSAVVEKRNWPDVDVRKEVEDGWLVASTDAMTLRYRLHSGAFTATNLEVDWKGAGSAHTWHPGEIDDRNLGGLTYSLDNVSTKNLPPDVRNSPVNDIIPGIDVLLPKSEPGLLSRNGFAFIDDSHTPLWNAASQWIEPRKPGNGQDWYLFTYGHDYRRVLGEYAELCGPVPMIPRYVLGPMVTDLNFEYFPGDPKTKTPAFERYGERHIEDEITRFRRDHIPLDTLVLDFAWHNYGWQGGYDWSPLIPHPDRLLKWLHARGIKVGLNDHPGYANTQENILSHHDSHAPAVLKALGQPLPPKPSFDLDLSSNWVFAIDPRDTGIREHWYTPGTGKADWKPIRTDASPAKQGYGNYAGITWYRTQVRLPALLPSRLYLYLSRQAKDYRLYVNGREVEHSHVRWPRRLTFADITPYVKAGQTNTIAVRIEPNEYGRDFLRGPTAIRNVKPPSRIYFDLSNKKQAEVSMRDLHGPLLRQGVAFWWVDGGSGAADMSGLNPQLWTNRVFYDHMQKQTGHRGFILSRYGGWGSERYPAYFTGDTYSEWPVLAYEVAYSVRGGNVLIPYISHDIGGFHGGKIDFDLYARWLEFGAFSPLLRLHSAHENPREGNLRMPWTYGNRGVALARKYFTLHTQLIPYTYTYAWIAHEKSLPILRPLYLHDPELGESYEHPHEYWFGSEMLVAPVLKASGNRTVWLPPGKWIDFFSGKHCEGGTTFTAHYATDETPVFARDGAIIPEQPADFAWSNAKPLDHLIVNVYGSGKGGFDMYEDDGISLAYEQKRYALTPMTDAPTGEGSHRIVIGPTRGSFAGQVQRRSYELRLHGIRKPASISVDGGTAGQWSWNGGDATATIPIPVHSIHDRLVIEWRTGAR
ncbi:MAG TPA: TIM-barrel domain-containing protein [Rhodanobacteraceae bacterium]|nr:TIM-barrel domain-containing protein [Rhodanobacteraceae bacterium]